jgi:hypothetical protein
VEGFIDGDKDKNSLNFQPLEREWKYYFLTKASHRSTGILSIPAKSDMEWIAFYEHELIAVIPHDEASLAYSTKHNFAYNASFTMEVFVANYSIRGTFLTNFLDKDIRKFYSSQIMIGKDVEVNNLLPHAQLTGFKAPHLILLGNRYHIATPLM